MEWHDISHDSVSYTVLINNSKISVIFLLYATYPLDIGYHQTGFQERVSFLCLEDPVGIRLIFIYSSSLSKRQEEISLKDSKRNIQADL
jgi:hypothetical protein